MRDALYDFYLKKDEPVRNCLLALRDIILSQDENVTNVLKYGMPFFCYRGKMFCYLWIHKKFGQPYLGIVEGKRVHHPALLAEKRSRMKIFLVDADRDLPVKTINTLLKKTLDLYRTGNAKI